MQSKYPFAVLKYRVGMIGNEDNTAFIYVKTTVSKLRTLSDGAVKYGLNDQEISKEQAMLIIEQKGLELAISNEFGQVWHDPRNTLRDFCKRNNVESTVL